MRNLNVVLVLAAGFFATVGCGDDTSSGGSGGGGSPSTGGNGAGPVGGSGGTGGDATGGGGDAPGGGGGGPGGMGPGYSCDDPVGATPPALTLTDLGISVDNPVQAKSPPGRPDVLFIVEQSGNIVIYENGALLPTPFLDVSSEIRSGGEEGLLGLAFHPDYATNGRFFIHYSQVGDGASTVMEYARDSADQNLANTTPVQLVMQHDTEEGNHNGGAVEFGNDGYLYISLGDGGGANDPECDSQNPANLLGKIVRVDVEGTPDANGYPAAPGNPNGAKFFHIGLRNAWRMSFDACSGDLYIGDVGQGQLEEIDIATEAAGALNFGWPIKEGTSNFTNNCPNPASNLVDPVTEYSHNNGCSVSGGVVYRGSVMPDLRGWYFYGDYCSGQVSMFRAVNGAIVGANMAAGLDAGNLSAFGQDGNGEVYALNLGGSVYRIDPAP